MLLATLGISCHWIQGTGATVRAGIGVTALLCNEFKYGRDLKVNTDLYPLFNLNACESMALAESRAICLIHDRMTD